MKVKQLIEELQKLDPELLVVSRHKRPNHHYDLIGPPRMGLRGAAKGRLVIEGRGRF